jgi:hypothetical protein
VEGLHKELFGVDNFGVGVILPNGTWSAPISEEYCYYYYKSSTYHGKWSSRRNQIPEKNRYKLTGIIDNNIIEHFSGKMLSNKENIALRFSQLVVTISARNSSNNKKIRGFFKAIYLRTICH